MTPMPAALWDDPLADPEQKPPAAAPPKPPPGVPATLDEALSAGFKPVTAPAGVPTNLDEALASGYQLADQSQESAANIGAREANIAASRSLPPESQFGVGVLKGAANTVTGAAKFIGVRSPTVDAVHNWSTANTPVESLGKVVEQGAEFFIPGLGEGAFMSKLPKLGSVAAPLAKAAYRFFTSGALGSAQSGSFAGGIATGALDGGMALLAPGLSAAFDAWGSKIRIHKIKPSKVDMDAGFSDAVVDRLSRSGEITGNLKQTYTMLTRRITDLATERNIYIAKSPVVLDAEVIFRRVLTNLRTKITQFKLTGSNESTLKAYQSLYRDTAMSFPQFKTTGSLGKMSLEAAEDAKEALGVIADFTHLPGGKMAASASDSARAMVADELYLQFKVAIDQAVPGGRVGYLNKQMAELFPIRRAITRQIPIDARSASITAMDLWASLPSIITRDPSQLALLAAVRAQRSMRFGNWLGRNAEVPSQILGNITKAGMGMLSDLMK